MFIAKVGSSARNGAQTATIVKNSAPAFKRKKFNKTVSHNKAIANVKDLYRKRLLGRRSQTPRRHAGSNTKVSLQRPHDKNSDLDTKRDGVPADNHGGIPPMSDARGKDIITDEGRDSDTSSTPTPSTVVEHPQPLPDFPSLKSTPIDNSALPGNNSDTEEPSRSTFSATFPVINTLTPIPLSEGIFAAAKNFLSRWQAERPDPQAHLHTMESMDASLVGCLMILDQCVLLNVVLL